MIVSHAVPGHPLTYLESSDVSAVKIAPERRPKLDRSGYGMTFALFQIKIGTRWHRPYFVCYSNAGTCLVNVRGKPVVIDTDLFYELEARSRNAT